MSARHWWRYAAASLALAVISAAEFRYAAIRGPGQWFGLAEAGMGILCALTAISAAVTAWALWTVRREDITARSSTRKAGGK